MRWVLQNAGWKLLSLGIAVVLWFLVVGEPTLTTSVSAPLEFRNIPSELEVNATVPERVQLEVRGSPSLLESSDLAKIAVVLDLSPVHRPGVFTFTLGRNYVTMPSGVEFVRAVPTQLRLRFEYRVTREVPVQVRFSKPPPDGYRVRSRAIAPERVRLTGADSRVGQVDFVETDPIDLTGVVGEREFTVQTFVGDPHVRFASSPVVRVRVAVEKMQPGDAP